MKLRFELVSIYLAILIITTFSWLQVANCSNSGGDDNSVEEVEEEKESDHDDELISQLLDTPIGNPDSDSDVARIMKILEAAEQATSTTTTTTTTTTTPTPTTTTPKPSTTTPSPFFKTERPSKYSSRVGKPDDLDEMIRYLDQSFKEAEQELGEGDDPGGKNATSADKISRRSDYHHHHHDPPVRSLLWGTAQAVWDVSRPVFSRTKVGRKIALAQDTLTLPLRTFGAVRHRIHDLIYHPYGSDRKHRSIFHHHGWDHHHDDHHHHHGHSHGWGWDSGPVYVKYEPDNSLFKSWLRYLYRTLRPAVITKIRLKRRLLRAKLRFIGRLVRFLKSIKLQKVFTALRALQTRLQILRSRLRPNIVVLKETGWTQTKVHDHHHHHGWGWNSDSGWLPGPPPTTATPAPSYGPKYQPPSTSYSDMTYGKPEMSYYGGYHKMSWGSQEPKPAYGAPPQATTTETYSPIAYNNDNTYANYRAPPAQWLMAPEQMMAQASEPENHDSIAEIEAPSYTNYLKQFGINPASLADNSPAAAAAVVAVAKELNGRNLRHSDKVKNSEDLPYIVSESGSDDETAKMDADKPPAPVGPVYPGASRM